MKTNIKIISILLSGTFGFFACSSDSPKTIPYKIVEKDSSAQQLTFRMTLEERGEKEQLIEIARQLKNERKWDRKLICFFDIKVPSNSIAWSSCFYLPDCKDCNTDKDKDGNGIEYKLIGLSKSAADSLNALKFDSIPNKTFIGSYIDDLAHCKTELYKLSDNPSKVLMVQLFKDGKTINMLKIKKADDQERFIYPTDEGVYITIDNTNKSLTYYNKENKAFQTYPIEL